MSRLSALAALMVLCTTVQAAPEVRFSPDGDIQKRLVAAIDSTSQTLDAALFELSSKTLINALKRAGERGVQIRMVMDEKVLREHPQTRALSSATNVALRTLHGHERKGGGMMHNKFAVFDGARIETGSYNWSQGAEYANYENVIFDDEPAVVQAYQAQFTDLWTRARPVGFVPDLGHSFHKHKTKGKAWLTPN